MVRAALDFFIVVQIVSTLTQAPKIPFKYLKITHIRQLLTHTVRVLWKTKCGLAHLMILLKI